MRNGSSNNNYRGNVEIVRDILYAARQEKPKYRMMRSTRLNQTQLDKYSNPLVELGYLEKKEVAGHKKFKTTSEGLEALEVLGRAVTIMKRVKKRLK